MKRALAFTLMVLAIMIIAVSCEEPQAHVHTYSEKWECDDNYHWHKATCHTDEVDGKEAHKFGNLITDTAATESTTGKGHRVCSVCGYEREEEISPLGHSHKLSSVYSKDATGHWQTCSGCSSKVNFSAHTIDCVSADDIEHAYKCTVCGYVEKTETHDIAVTTYSSSKKEQWCTKCSYKKSLAAVETKKVEVTSVKKAEITTTSGKTEITIVNSDGSITKEEVDNDKIVENTQQVNITTEVIATAEVSSSSTTTTEEKKETTVSFPAGALKMKEGATEVKLTVTALTAEEATSSKSEYQKQNTDTATGTTSVKINSDKAVVAGFEFKLSGAVASNLSGSTGDGTTVTTFIAKGLADGATQDANGKITKENLSNYVNIEYIGDEGTKPSIESYNNKTGELVFTVYHFSKYAIIAEKIVATDNAGTMYSSLESALSGDANRTITLLKDFKLQKRISIDKTITINLNGKTLTLEVATSNSTKNEGAFELPIARSGYTVTIKNGTIKGKVEGKQPDVFALHKNAGLTLDGVILDNVDAFRGIQVSPNTESATLTVKDSKINIKGAYAVATEATVDADGKTSEDVTMSITNSTLETETGDDDNTGLLINVPGTYTISGSTISGERQGAIIRGGTVAISGSTLKSTATKTDYTDWTEAEDKAWNNGNQVPLAAIVIGNRNGSYAYPTSVTFSGTNVLEVDTSKTRKQIYIYKAGQASKDDSTDRNVTVTGFKENWTVNESFNGAVVKSGTTLLVNDGETLKAAISCVANDATIKFTNDVTCTLNDKNSDSGCDTSLWFESENVTMDFNTKKLVVKSNCGGSYNIINAFGAGCTFRNGEIFVYRKNGEKTVSKEAYGYDQNYPYWDSYALGVEFGEKGNCTIENMTLHGGIAIYGYVNATITNGTYADATNYYALWAEGYCTATVRDCTLTGSENNPIFSVNSENCSVTVESGTYEGKLTKLKGSLSITGGTFSSNPAEVEYEVTENGVQVKKYVNYVSDGYESVENEEEGTWTVNKSSAD